MAWHIACAEVGRVLSGVLMPFKPLSLGLTGALLPPPELLPQVLPTMTPPVKGANNVAITSRLLYRVVRMVVFARFWSAAPYRNKDPTTVTDP